jgi:hypothetical protein
VTLSDLTRKLPAGSIVTPDGTGYRAFVPVGLGGAIIGPTDPTELVRLARVVRRLA